MSERTAVAGAANGEEEKASGTRPSKDKKRRRGNFAKDRKRLMKLCKEMLGDEVAEIAYPGGKSRDAVLLTLEDGREVIAAVRKNQHRAGLEHDVLSALSSRGAPVPAVLGFDGETLLLQQKLRGRRLSQEMHMASTERLGQLLDSALHGLGLAQGAGSEAGLDERLPALGVGKDWINGLMRRPLVIGGYLQERPGRPRVEALRKLLRVQKPRFIKWDARPGNAMVDADGVSWFDWEHSGTRNRMDDVAWLLCDEFTPDVPELESELIARHLGAFADQMSLDQAHTYLRAYGVFHSVVRLGLILSLKKDEEWWDFDYCVAGDKVGVTLDCALRVSLRAARWADMQIETRALSPWFGKIADKLRTV